MAFLIPKNNPPSLASTSPSMDDEKPVGQRPVTSCLYLSSDRRSLNKDVVLRRIRHRKRVNRVRDAFQALFRPDPAQTDVDRDAATTFGWLDDAFSSP